MTEEIKEQEPEVPVEPAVKKGLQNNVDMVSEITTELKRFFTFDILNYIRKPWKLIGLNFFMGLVRGIGFFLGMTIIGAIVFAMLTKGLQAGIEAKIPLLSEWLAHLVAMVQENMQMLK
ncbi:MAG: hypothetical protein COZ15_03345 [Elusimicrobia bacterium CG_4_10_14_3_um_filter_49_12_50_7]|nr:MAG: hypothetical protein COS41_06685 [Elusimicrobia bacterium CG03_land_8_20_14_0_80_50_18]PIX14382.1 MAG: hypothetical protein COZ72_06255 [Elusimicrobia bacterium CG_4_8_14_3_um_filter_50_9]PIY17188.1 MAG: hypothetical protein COZ15_03345 [Elusimicrobia bacterium CG_4_10_14_3_um_filter_49_12_50_7]